jgi:hypothetical protein
MAPCHPRGILLDIFSKLRMAFEKRGLRVPVNRTIREDLHSVNPIDRRGSPREGKDAPEGVSAPLDRKGFSMLGVE